MCSIATYIACWYQPLGINTATEVKLSVAYKELEDATDWSYISMMNSANYSVESIASSRIREGVLILAMMALLTFYAGMHIIGWSSFFPTTAEMLGWHACIWTMIGCDVTFGLILLCGTMLPESIFKRMRSLLRVSEGRGSDILVDISWAILIVSVVAGLFIVVESFISLRSLPYDAYKLPTWSKYIPHFS